MHELQLPNVDFELDAKKLLITSLEKEMMFLSLEQIVDECRRSCNDYFENSKVEFSQKQANVVVIPQFLT